MLHKNILNIRDEDNLGEVYHRLESYFDQVKISNTDIITQGIFQRFEKYNQKITYYLRPIVKLKPGEVFLKIKSNRKRPHLNVEKPIEIIPSVFQNNVHSIQVDEHRTESINEIITITSETSFIKLTPFISG